MALDKVNYDLAYMIVVLNLDGSLYGAFRETAANKGKMNMTSLLFDSSNFITAAVDLSLDGSSTNRVALIARFSVGNAAATTITPTFYQIGGTTGQISAAYILQRIYADQSTIYVSAVV